jgi:ribosomal-protein-alanine N-acetyltransferase
MTILTTQRLLLRPMRADDVDAFHAMMRDPETMRFWSTPPHADRSVTKEWVMTGLGRLPVTDFVIELDGTVVGKAGAWRLPEVGFMIDRQHWRQGIATEAMNAVIPYLFANFDCDSLTADVDPRNTASLAALQNLGFAETHRAENTFFINGEWCHSIYLALPRPAP